MKKILTGLSFVSGIFLAGADCDPLGLQLAVNITGIIIFALTALAIRGCKGAEK